MTIKEVVECTIVFSAIGIGIYCDAKNVFPFWVKTILAGTLCYLICFLSTLAVIENVKSIFDSYWYAFFLLASIPFQYAIMALIARASRDNLRINAVGAAVIITSGFPLVIASVVYADEDVFDIPHIAAYSLEFAMLLALFYAIKKDADNRRRVRKSKEAIADKVFSEIILCLKDGVTMQECLGFIRLKGHWLSEGKKEIYLHKEEMDILTKKLQEYYNTLTEEEKIKDNKAYHEYKKLETYNPYLTEKSLFGKFVR